MSRAGDSPCALMKFVFRLPIRCSCPQTYKNSEIAENGKNETRAIEI